MARRRVVRPKVLDGVHVNFEACKQAFRTFAFKHGRTPMGWAPWGKSYVNRRKDGIQWKMWLLSLGFNKRVEAKFKTLFPFTSMAGVSARAWTHKSDFDRRKY